MFWSAGAKIWSTSRNSLRKRMKFMLYNDSDFMYWMSVVSIQIQNLSDTKSFTVSFWHEYNRSGTLMFKVKMVGLSRYYRSADPPYKSHNAKRAWFSFGFWRHRAMGLFSIILLLTRIYWYHFQIVRIYCGLPFRYSCILHEWNHNTGT